jgi:4-amino-4-deoxy-L-arabinose transferase-like glycosyltransferase
MAPPVTLTVSSSTHISAPQSSLPEFSLAREQASRAADLGCVALLLLLAAAILLLRNSAVPMQIWDESRNANSGLEMSRNGHLLVSYFRGAPDHWNTKPPLLIWCMALLFHLGLPPLAAVRLPSNMAAIATVLLVFFFCRNCLRDRFAGLIGGLTLLAAPLFVGWHSGRTGDVDSLVTLFTLSYTLAFWGYVEAQGRTRTLWIAIAGIAVALSVLTKGVGGVLALPGFLFYAIFRGRLAGVLLDRRLWLTLLSTVLVCGGYYGLREHFDPGYLEAVWRNEFTGRYLAVSEQHQGGPLYYFWTLAVKFEPGFLLLPLAVIPLFQSDRRRRSVTLLCLLTSVVLFAVLSKSQTKIFWYMTPATPFLALAASIGLSDSMAWLRAREQTLAVFFRPRFAYAAVAAIFGVAQLASVYYYQIGVERKLAGIYMEGRYGPFLEQIRDGGLTKSLVILDYGVRTEVLGDRTGQFVNYSPEAVFYAQVEGSRGMQVQVVVPGRDLPPGSWIATCDPRSDAWLTEHYHVALVLQPNPWCKLARNEGAKPASPRDRG